MGVPIGDAEGEYPVLLDCGDCGERYETDETMPNDCPHCGGWAWEIIDGERSAPWRTVDVEEADS